MVKYRLPARCLQFTLALSLIFSGCASPSSPNPAEVGAAPIATSDVASLLESEIIDPNQERQRWENLLDQWGQSPFIPDAFQSQLTEDEKRQKIVNLYALLDARDKVFQGTATDEERVLRFLIFCSNV